MNIITKLLDKIFNKSYCKTCACKRRKKEIVVFSDRYLPYIIAKQCLVCENIDLELRSKK